MKIQLSCFLQMLQHFGPFLNIVKIPFLLTSHSKFRRSMIKIEWLTLELRVKTKVLVSSIMEKIL